MHFLVLLFAGLGSEFEESVFQSAASVLSQHCVRCHNADKSRGGLDLSSHESVLAGGATSDVVKPSKPDESPLLLRTREGSMPPEKDGRRLNKAEIKALSDWIELGAIWPAGVALPLSKEVPTSPKMSGAGVQSARPAQQVPLQVPLRRRRFFSRRR